MKKIFLSLAMIAFVSAGAFAQGVSGGLKVGLNLAKQKMEYMGISDDSDSKASFLVGGYLTAMLSEKFGVQPELLYSGMGSKDGFKMGYLTVPIMLRYNVSDNVNIQAGPQVGFLMSAKTEDGDVDVKDAFKGIDFGAAFGVGLDFGKFNAGARYYLGLSDIGDNLEFDGEAVEIKNSAIQIFVGVKLFGE